MKNLLFAGLVLGLALAIQTPVHAGPKKVKALVFADIKPIFDQNCVKCHMGPRARGRIHLDSYKGIMEGGEDGKIVVAGHPEKSALYGALSGQKGVRQMPPQSRNSQVPVQKLDSKLVSKLKQWIKDGAKEK